MSFAIIINPVSGGARPAESRARIAAAASVCDLDGLAADVLVTERAGQGGELGRRRARWRGERASFSHGAATERLMKSRARSRSARCRLPSFRRDRAMASRSSWGSIGVPIVPSPARSPHGRGASTSASRRPRFRHIAGIGFDAHVASRFNGPGNVARGFANYLSIGGRALLMAGTRRCLTRSRRAARGSRSPVAS